MRPPREDEAVLDGSRLREREKAGCARYRPRRQNVNELKQIAPGLGGRPGASLSEALGGDPHPAGETGPELRGLGVLSASGLAGGDARGRTKMRFMHASAAQNAWGTREPNTFEIVC